MKRSPLMRMLFLFSVFMLLACHFSQVEFPWDKGGFETREYRNVFVEAGYAPDAVEAKLDEVFNDVFRGPNKAYFEVGDSMAYISDIKNNDVPPRV